MVRYLSLRGSGGGDVFAIVFLLDTHLEIGAAAPIDVVSRADAPESRTIVRTHRIQEGRFGYLKVGADDGRTDVDRIIAAVVRQDVAAASYKNELMTPIACPEATCQPRLRGSGPGALIRIPHHEVLGRAVRLDVGVEVREARGIVRR